MKNPRIVTKGPVAGAAAVAGELPKEHAVTEAYSVDDEVLFQEIFGLSSIPMAQADLRTGMFLRVNNGLCAMVGYAAEELLRMNIADITHPDDRERTSSEFKRAVEGDLPRRSWEKRFVRKDGEVVWGRVNMTTIGGRPGLPLRTIAIIEDVSERKRTEAALLEVQARLSAAFANMADAVFISDSTGRFTDFNDAFATFHRFASKEQCLKTFAEYPDILDVFLPSGEPAPLDQWAVPRALRGETATNAEYTLRRRDTGETWVGSYSFSPMRDGKGGIVGSVVVARDVTDQKRAQAVLNESERRYRGLFENMNEGLAHCRMIYEDGRPVDFVYVAANEMFSKLTGLVNVVGKRFSELVPTVREADPDLFELYGRVATSGRPEKVERFNHALGIWFQLSIFAAEPGHFVALFDVINERKRAEEALRRSEARLKAIFNGINDAAIFVDTDRRVLMVNRAFSRLFGYSAEETVGQSTARLYADPSEHAEMGGLAYNSSEETHVNLCEVRYVRKDGSRFWAESMGSRIFDSTGKLIGFVGIHRDVTERKKAEAALQLTQFSVDHSGDAIFWIREDGTFDRVNPAAVNLLGFTAEELLGMSAMDVDPAATPEVRAAEWRHLMQVGPRTFESEFKTKSGRMVPVEISSNGIKFEDLKFNCAYVRDITARKLAEAELRERTAFFEAQIESSPDAVLVVNEFERTVLQNQRLSEIFQIPDTLAADDKGHALHSFIAAQTKDPQRHLERVRHLYEHRDEVGRDEIQLTDGRVLDRYSAPVRDASGRYYGRIWTLRDVTERRQLEAQFLRAQRMEAIGTLSGGIAHDLNNILAPLLLATEVLRDSLKDESEREMMNLIEVAAKRGAGIVRQLLTFSRGIEGARVSVQVRHLIKEMAAIARETFPRNISIRDAADKDLWPVLADATQLHQILMNLCVNARDAMPSGGELTLGATNMHLAEGDARLKPPAHPGRYVLVSVSDNGEGIPRENIDRIFDPFFTTKGLGKGSGLGLSTVLGIVRSHEGFVTVVSKPRHGSVFSVWLPAASDSQDPAEAGSKGKPSAGHGEMVLVVDDELPILVAVKRCLEDNGYRVVTAMDGQEAIGVFFSHQQDVKVVLTDMMMPVLDGKMLAHALHALDPKVRVISSSGLDLARSPSDTSAGFIAAYLKKPYENAVLLGAIDQQIKAYGSAPVAGPA